MAAWLTNPEEDLARYRAWLLHYLYRNLKATNKLEPLDRNGAVRIRCLPVRESGVLEFLNRLMALFRAIEIDDGASDDMELTDACSIVKIEKILLAESEDPGMELTYTGLELSESNGNATGILFIT